MSRVGRSREAEQGMRRSYDVVIIGGGVMGSSAAYWLAANPGFNGSILMVERDPTSKHATKARPLGSILPQFSPPENPQSWPVRAASLSSIRAFLSTHPAA